MKRPLTSKPSVRNLSRRDFLKLSALGIGAGFAGHAFAPVGKATQQASQFPKSERLGRVCVGKVEVKDKPHAEANIINVLYEDTIVPWVHETVGTWPWRNNQRWVETDAGYIWSAYVQPVRNQPNQPLSAMPSQNPDTPLWVEVTVPYAEAVMDNPPPRSHWFQFRLEHSLPLRFYYSQILSVDKIKTDDTGQVWYRVNEEYGNPGDILWAPGEAFRPITNEELNPITPGVEDKHIEVDASWNRQILSCYEGKSEVYYCRISSGVESGSTPLSAPGSPGFPIWRKLHSIHMSGGTNADGWDLPGIGWTSLFHGEGVAIHSTFWHNNFGEPMSHGCVNASPEDAKWIFRWSLPHVPHGTGDNTVTLTGDPSTRVTVFEG